ncbi:MAG: class I SAM-dependent methyltransferase [candidate division FCPU426 bacterium]
MGRSTNISDAERYTRLEYYSPERMAQYFFQIESIREASAQSVLEIGTGPGVVAHILRRAGLQLATCDVNPELGADICADVRRLPLPDNAVDFALCCQVLEHLPFAELGSAVAELARVSRTRVLISVPYSARVVYLLSKLPFGRKRGWTMHFSWPPVTAPMVAGHHWEIGRPGYSKRKFINAIRAAGVKIVRTFTPVETPGNLFCLLAKQ